MSCGVPQCPDCECEAPRKTGTGFYEESLVPIDDRMDSIAWETVKADAGLDAKLQTFDEYAPAAVRYLIDWLRDNPEQILAVARGRLVTGHYVYGDTQMYEFDQGRLLKEVLEELADGVVYQHLHLSRA